MYLRILYPKRWPLRKCPSKLFLQALWRICNNSSLDPGKLFWSIPVTFLELIGALCAEDMSQFPGDY